MVASHLAAGCCVEIGGPRAYFLHSNRGNPCEDIMLAFGDLPPGGTTESTGHVRVVGDDARRVLVAQ